MWAGAGQYSGGGQNSTGGSPNSSRSNSTDQDESGNNLFDVSETDFDSIDFDFNESATRKWISDNPDLSPLKVLDHISFKPDPAPDLHHQDAPKPPDLATLDRDTASILQLAVPVPDPSSTFLDIGNVPYNPDPILRPYVVEVGSGYSFIEELGIYNIHCVYV